MNFTLIWQSLPFLWNGFLLTLGLAAVSIAGSTLLGLVVAALRTSRIPVVPALARAYVEVFRGSPIPITLLFVYFGAALYLGAAVYFNPGAPQISAADGASLSLVPAAILATLLRGIAPEQLPVVAE